MRYDYFLICPQNPSDEELRRIRFWVTGQEFRGVNVYYPARDTNQNQDESTILKDNRQAMIQAKQVALFWSARSTDYLYDLGMANALGKTDNMLIINASVIQKTAHKSFDNFLIALAEQGRQR